MMRRRLLMGNKKENTTELLLHFDYDTKDSSKHNRQILSSNNVTYVAGMYNGALNVQSLSTYIEFDKTFFEDLLRTKLYTIEFWGKFIQKENAWGSFFGIDDGTTNGFNFSAQYGTNFSYGTYSSRMFSVYMSVSDVIAWNHYAIVSDGQNVLFFVNGVKKATGVAKTVNLPSGVNLTIGGRKNNNDVPASNYIDEFRISNKALYTTDFTPPINAYTR